MDNPLNRKMFRQAGMSKQPMGILASSPELMNAVRGFNLGGLNTVQIPMYGQMKPRSKSNTAIGIEQDLDRIENIGIAEDFGETKDTAPVDVFKNPAIDSEVINNQNKKVLEDKTEETDETKDFDPKDLMPFGKNMGIRGKTESGMSDDPKIIDAKNAVNESMGRVANARIKNFRDVEIAGSTYNKAIKDVTDQLNKEGKEIGLDDVYDEGMKLLGYDPRKLDEQFDADKRQAFWFNLINAGLQVAAGQSSNAITNLANGLGKGLQGFGKDVGELRADLREDRKEATNVMYRLLNNKRSEQLAKEALELDKKMKIFEITKAEVGERKNEAIKAAEFEFEQKKFNLNYLIELKKYDQKEKLSENQIKGALRNTIINNKAISVPFMLGLIEPKDGYTMDTVDIADPNTYSFTDDGMKIAKDIYDNTKTYKPTNREQIKKENKGTSTGPAGIVFNTPEKNDGTLATNWAQNINNQFVKDVSDNPDNAAKLLLDHVSQYKEQGAQIDLNKLKGLYPEIHNYFISNKKDENEVEIPNSSPLATNSDLFKTTKSVDLSK